MLERYNPLPLLVHFTPACAIEESISPTHNPALSGRLSSFSATSTITPLPPICFSNSFYVFPTLFEPVFEPSFPI